MFDDSGYLLGFARQPTFWNFPSWQSQCTLTSYTHTFVSLTSVSLSCLVGLHAHAWHSWWLGLGYLGSGYKISPERVEELAEGSREVKTGEVEGGTVCLEGGRGQESAQDRARTLTGARGKADLESGKGQGVWFAQQSAHGSAIQAGCVEQKGRDALAI